MIRLALTLATSLLLSSGHAVGADGEQGSTPPATIQAETLPLLPRAVSNNAVALLAGEDGFFLVTALGLGAGKQADDTLSDSWLYDSRQQSWQSLADVPGAAGRLAASAVSVAGRVYLFGGYTVAADGSEQSTPQVFRLNVETRQWDEFSRMPVAVEDAVVLAHQDRYIYLVSGWHDVGNVNLVQVLDTATGSWAQATPWPGAPVFGHAGGISAGRMVVCDGVRIRYPADGTARQFESSGECWLGRIHTDDFRRVHWQPLPQHPGPARYRMASVADASGRVWFAGGAVNPYNFNGIGYDGNPSEPTGSLFSIDLVSGQWACHGMLEPATMDHRGLLWHDGWFYLVGGMQSGQQVSRQTYRFQPPAERDCQLSSR